MAFAGNAVLGKLSPGRRIDRVPDLLPAGGGGGDLEAVAQPALADHILHDELRHGTAANVAVTDEQDPDHAHLPVDIQRFLFRISAVSWTALGSHSAST